MQSDALCAIRLKIKEEPLVIARYLGPATNHDNTKLLFQWCGSYHEYRYPTVEDRICQMQWLNGWLQTDGRFYWKENRDHSSHVPYTNIHTGDTIDINDVVLSGFKCKVKCKVPVRVARSILSKWHGLPAPEPVPGDATDTFIRVGVQFPLKTHFKCGDPFWGLSDEDKCTYVDHLYSIKGHQVPTGQLYGLYRVRVRRARESKRKREG